MDGDTVQPVGMFDGIEPQRERVDVGPGDALACFEDGRRGHVLTPCARPPAGETAARIDAARRFSVGRLNDDAALLPVRVPEA